MDTAELNDVIALHDKWLKGLPEGKQAKLADADLRGITLDNVSLQQADLRKADLSDAQLYSVDLTRANLREANLSHATAGCTDLTQASMQRANLRKAVFDGSNLTHANLRDANLFGASFYRADCHSAVFVRVDARKADFGLANLHVTNFSDARLDEANFTTAHISQTQLHNTRTIILELPFWRATVLPTTVRIGCQHHPHQAWIDFTHEQITAMHMHSLLWWNQYKPLVVAAIEAVRSQPQPMGNKEAIPEN